MSPLVLVALLAVLLAGSLGLVASLALLALLVAYVHHKLGAVAEQDILALQELCLELDKPQDFPAELDKAAVAEFEDRHLSRKMQ